MKTDSRPNILLLTADQQRFDTIGALNASFMQTPNLDRLVREGCAWTMAHSPNPVCVSARHNILTGLPARFHGMPHNKHCPLPASLPTLPGILSGEGYATAAIGKMHFGPVRSKHGFQTLRLMEEIPARVEDDEYLQYLQSVGLGDLLQVHGSRVLGYQMPQRSIMPEEHHGSTWVANEAADYIEQNKDRPWFLWASWIAPHPPANVPDTFADMYSGADLPPVRGIGKESPEARRFRELYYSAISLVDKGVGIVLDKLDELGLTDNTLVIYTSDHGEMLGDLGLVQKQLPYDGSVRVPLLVRLPGRVEPGRRCDEFADLNDILPTALDAAGISAPRFDSSYTYPGGSLLAESGKDRSFQYAEFGDLEEKRTPRWIMFRDSRWKYIYWFGAGGKEELYDMTADPYELNDLSKEPTHNMAQALDSLRRRAINHELKWGLAGSVSDNGFSAIFDSDTGRSRNTDIIPDWSICQWPVFAQPYTDRHFDQLEKEFALVSAHENLAACARTNLDETKLAGWWEQWHSRGGDEARFVRVFGRRPPSESGWRAPALEINHQEKTMAESAP